MKPVVLFIIHNEPKEILEGFVTELEKHFPDGVDGRFFPDCGDPNDIQYAVAWRQPPNSLRRFPNLKMIFTPSAGVDHLLEDKTLPDVLITRLTDYDLQIQMARYVCWGVLHLYRKFYRTLSASMQGEWCVASHIEQPPRTMQVLVLGFGRMGTRSAELLSAMDFRVTAWKRSPPTAEQAECARRGGIEVAVGAAALDAALGSADVVVNLLPNTPETAGILCADLFRKLRPGYALVNAGRGPAVVEDDLVRELRDGRCSHALLDVFRMEPLPADSEFWQLMRERKVTVTPHVASITSTASAMQVLAAHIRDVEAGRAPPRVDLRRGY